MADQPDSGPMAIPPFHRNRGAPLAVDVMKAKIFHVITKLELGGAQKVTLMTLERLPRDRYDVALITNPDGLLVEWANRIPGLKLYWLPSLIREVVLAVGPHIRGFGRIRPLGPRDRPPQTLAHPEVRVEDGKLEIHPIDDGRWERQLGRSRQRA